MKTGESRLRRVQNNNSAPQAKDMKKNRLFNAALVLLAFVLTCAFIAFGSFFRIDEGNLYGIVEGYPSNVIVLAPREITNTVATERNRQSAQERADALIPSRTMDPRTWDFVENNLNILAESLESIREFHAHEIADFEQAVSDSTEAYNAERAAYEAAVAEWESGNALLEEGESPPPRPEPPTQPESVLPEFQVWAMFDPLPFTLSVSQQELILSMDEYTYEHLWDVILDVAYNTQARDIAEVDALTIDSMRSYVGEWALDRDTIDIVDSIVAIHLTPNQIVDEEATQRWREAEAASYQVVTLMEGQIIVNVGEIVDREIFVMLEELALLGDDATIADLLIPIGGAFIVVALIFFACLLYLTFYRPSIAAIKREAFLLFTLYVLVLSVVWSLSDFPYPFLPILIFPMLVSVLIERRSAIILSASFTFICFFIVIGSLDFLLFFLFAGFLISMLSRFTTDRNKIFLVSMAVLLLQFALSISIALVLDVNDALYSITDLVTVAGFAAFNGLLTVIISIGSLPIWESFFGVVTPVKLLDLTNPTNLLLRRLTIEAPGTYHHSLIVANLAETAAYDIGANAHAARVGGYYHDIGKLKFPQYFAENIDSANPHDDMEPFDSAHLIISHVSYGLKYATVHKLPQFVRDIIQEHHGTSLLQFFYHKALEFEDTVDDKDYRYPFVIPQTRESACVMLADCVEAAVRSMMPKIKSIDEMDDTIRGLIRSKLNDGQLADSQLSIRDVEVIEGSFMRVLKGMYHERIPYPKLVPVEDAEAVIVEDRG